LINEIYNNSIKKVNTKVKPFRGLKAQRSEAQNFNASEIHAGPVYLNALKTANQNKKFL
jgi:hypothetical protein